MTVKMKKIIFLIFILFLTSNSLFAIEEIVLPKKDLEKEIILEPVVLEKEEINPYTKEALRGIIEKNYDLNNAQGMFHEQLKLNFKKGIIKDVGLQGNFISTATQTIDDNDSDFKLNSQLINIGLKGKFKSEKEGYNFLFDVTPNIHENFFHRLVLDAWVETKRIPNHTLIFGTSRPTVGYEGGQSPYLVPFLSRSQTARTFGNVRKTGIRLKGDYKYVDYDLGGYSSDTWYSEFMPGIETDLWVNFKPLVNIKDKGKLNIGGGVQTGSRNSHDFTVVTSAIRYDYKNFWMRAEYANADGYNGGAGLSEKKAQGYNLTLAYRFTKKLEFLLRYDEFNPDKSKANDDKKEYSAGINYFILGQTMRLMFNYVFCENKIGIDSHRLIFGTQFLL